jgi:hypothetical protein
MTATDTTDVRAFPHLRAGETGEWVAYLQRTLAFHQDPALPETGMFDRATADALAAFQARLGIAAPVAHEVGTETWWHLTNPCSLLPEAAPEPTGWVLLALPLAA